MQARVSRLMRRCAASALQKLLQRRRVADRPQFGPGSPLTFFIWNAFSVGGTVRTVTQQATSWAERGHAVTIVSVVRRPGQKGPFFALHPNVRVEVLVDRAALEKRRGPLARLTRRIDRTPPISTQLAIGRSDQASLLTEQRLLRRVMAARRGVVVGTRANLNLALSRFGHPGAIRVAQEHLYLGVYSKPHRQAILRHYGALDLVACLTEADAAAYRSSLPRDRRARVEVVPNAIPTHMPEPSAGTSHRIVAVGRLARSKGFEQLIDAFALVADGHPTWTVRIVGSGRRKGKLRARIADRGLEDRVELVGRSSDVASELAQASVFAMTSRFEAFGLVVLEAMAAGLAIVSFATPPGPRELLTHDRNALVVAPGDVTGFARHLDLAIGQPWLRRRLGRQARLDAQTYTADRVSDRWEAILVAIDADRTGMARSQGVQPPAQERHAIVAG